VCGCDDDSIIKCDVRSLYRHVLQRNFGIIFITIFLGYNFYTSFLAGLPRIRTKQPHKHISQTWTYTCLGGTDGHVTYHQNDSSSLRGVLHPPTPIDGPSVYTTIDVTSTTISTTGASQPSESKKIHFYSTMVRHTGLEAYAVRTSTHSTSQQRSFLCNSNNERPKANTDIYYIFICICILSHEPLLCLSPSHCCSSDAVADDDEDADDTVGAIHPEFYCDRHEFLLG
jgi:hypothetical protein